MKDDAIQEVEKNVDQIIGEMDLFDDDLMSMVFDKNIQATELLLKVILKRDDIVVISVAGQREFQNPIVGGRNIRLDILVQDCSGKFYNVEVQKKPEGAHIRRARFNSSMLDSRMLKEGQEFSELRDSYVVFITQTDIFGHGMPIYTINRYFEEIDSAFEDGSHIVYVNGSYKGDDAIGKLMHDFGCKRSEDIYYPELAEGVKHFKEEEGGRRIMCESVEKYADKKAETVRMDNQFEILKNLMESLKLTAEQAMAAMQLSEQDKAALLKRL